jgi:hypothetical protein
VLERLAQLSSIFTIEICAYAVLSNHYHLVLFVDQRKAKELSREAVVERWAAILSVPSTVARHMSGEALEAEGKLAESKIEVGNVFGRAMGRLNHLRLHANTLGQSWVRGLRRSEALFNR